MLLGDVWRSWRSPVGRRAARQPRGALTRATPLVRSEPGSASPLGSAGLGQRSRARVPERKRLRWRLPEDQASTMVGLGGPPISGRQPLNRDTTARTLDREKSPMPERTLRHEGQRYSGVGPGLLPERLYRRTKRSAPLRAIAKISGETNWLDQPLSSRWSQS